MSSTISPSYRTLWLKRLLLAEIILLWAEVVLVAFFSPTGEPTIWKLPPNIARISITAAAVGWSLIATAAWYAPRFHIAQTSYGWLIRLRRTPVWLIPFLLILSPATYLILSNWLGDIILALALIVFAALIYLFDDFAWIAESPLFVERAAILVIALGMILRLIFLFTEFVWTDEAFHVSAMSSILDGGDNVPTILRFPAYVHIYPLWGYATALYGFWGQLTGVGLIQARAFSYLIGLIGLPAIYLCARYWYDRVTGLITASFAALSLLFMESTIARPDAVGMAAVSWVLLLHVIAFRQKRGIIHTLVGALAALTVETHLVNFAFLMALGAYYTYDFIRRVSRREGKWYSAPLWFYLAGALPLVGLYIYLHILTLPYPDRYFAFLSVGGTTHNFLQSRLPGAAYRYRNFWNFAPVEAALMAASMLAAALRRRQSDIHWLILMVFIQVGYFLIGPVGEIHYDIYGLPIFITGVGALVTHVWDASRQTSPLRQPLTYMALSILLISPVLHLMVSHRGERLARENDEINPITGYIRSHLPPTATVIGPPVYYTYLVEYRSFIGILDVGEANQGPIMAGMDPDAYWQSILLQSWPDAWIGRHFATRFDHPSVFNSYFASRENFQPVPGLWVAQDSLISNAAYAQPSQADLQMVAHQPLPDQPVSSSEFDLHTIWVMRHAARQDYQAEVSVIDSSGKTILSSIRPVLDAHSDTPVSLWASWTFHNVKFKIGLPDELPVGAYLLKIDLQAEDGANYACETFCSFIVTQFAIN